MEFLSVLNQILILFLLIIAGYAARKLNVFNENTEHGLTSILVKIALPALIISSMPHDYSFNVLKESGYILFISFGVYAFSFILAFVLSALMRPEQKSRGVLEFVMIFSNVGFMGYPVVEAVFGKDALFYTAIYNIPFNILAFSAGIYLLTRGGESGKGAWKKAFVNPGLCAVVIGFMIFFLPVKPPSALMKAIDLMGSTTTPFSMFLIGALLTHLKPGKIFSNWRVFAVSAVRLFILPLSVWLILKNILTDKLLVGVSVIIAAMPAAANTVLLAEEYNADAELASQSIFISTLLSIVTIPLIAVLIK